MVRPSPQHETRPVSRWLMTEARQRVDASDFLEAFANQLRAAVNRSLLLSSDFTAISGAPVEPLGAFALKGVGAKQEIFVPVR